MTDMLRFNIQVYLTGHNTEERDLILGMNIWRESINAAKSAVTQLIKNRLDPRLNVLDAYPNAKKIKWQLWGGVTHHAPQKQRLSYNRVERKSKPITARMAPVQKYVEVVMIWHPHGGK